MLVGVFGLALATRWQGLATAQVLGDSMGPWWRAASDAPWRPHAPLFGWGLNLPHFLILPFSRSLWGAVRALFAVHALVAPLAALLILRLEPRAWGGAVIVGLLVALDPGLIDTTLAGTKGYLAPLWAGLMLLGTQVERPGRAGFLAGLGFGFAVMNHPFSLCLSPLLLVLPWNRRALIGLLPGLLLPLPSLSGLLEVAAEHPPDGRGALVEDALQAFMDKGGPAGLLVLAGPILGLLSARTRPVALGTLASAGLLFAAGLGVAHLKDYHLRLIVLPALSGWAAFAGPGPLLGLLLLRPPPDPLAGADALRRPGSLGLETALTLKVAAIPSRPLVVDGAWFSASPAAEPGAILLDLWLRGESTEDLQPGGLIVVIASAERGEVVLIEGSLQVLDKGDRHRLLVGTEAEVAAWSQGLCERHPRLGGAWDGLAALHPDLDAAVIGRWWPCP